MNAKKTAFPLVRMATLLLAEAVKGGSTLDQIAAKAGIAVGRLYEIRKGDHGLTENSVAKLAQGLGIEPIDFYRRGLAALDAESAAPTAPTEAP